MRVWQSESEHTVVAPDKEREHFGRLLLAGVRLESLTYISLTPRLESLTCETQRAAVPAQRAANGDRVRGPRTFGRRLDRVDGVLTRRI